jgi:hypothetical protein
VALAEVPDPAAEGLELGNPVLDPSLGCIQQRRHARADRFVGVAEVAADVR